MNSILVGEQVEEFIRLQNGVSCNFEPVGAHSGELADTRLSGTRCRGMNAARMIKWP